MIGSALRAGSRLTSQTALKTAYRCNSTASAPAKKSFSKWSLFKGVVKFGTVAFIGYGGYGKWAV
jgi:NADH:ubiquinone reductase (non-electrogenic)